METVLHGIPFPPKNRVLNAAVVPFKKKLIKSKLMNVDISEEMLQWVHVDNVWGISRRIG